MAYVDIEQITAILLVLKMIISKKVPLFVKECFKYDHLEWSYGTKHSILKIT